MTITLDSLHADLVAMRAGITGISGDINSIRHDLVRLEAKIDSKPSMMAMFSAVLIVVFGMTGVIASTVAILAETHFLK